MSTIIMIHGLKKTTIIIEKQHFTMWSVISKNVNSKLSISATSFENLFKILPCVFFSKNMILDCRTFRTIVSWSLWLIPMNILIDMNLPMNELRSAKAIIAIRTKLYYISEPPSSCSFSVNLWVNVKAKKRLTAIEQQLMMACNAKMRTMPPVPPHE